MSDALRSQIQSLLGASQEAAAPAAAPAASPGLDYGALADALLARQGSSGPTGAPAAAPAPTLAGLLAERARVSRPPVSDAGGPGIGARYTEDTPLWQLTPADRDHIIRTRGHGFYAAKLREQLRGVRIKLR